MDCYNSPRQEAEANKGERVFMMDNVLHYIFFWRPLIH